MARPLIALAVVGLVAGCSGGDPSTAATVGQTTIGVDEVQSEARWVAANVPEYRSALQGRQKDPQGKTINAAEVMAEISRKVLSDDIRHELVTDVARRNHLTADPAKIDEAIEQAGGQQKAATAAGVPPADVRSTVTDQVLTTQLARRAMGTVKVRLTGGLLPAQGTDTQQAASDLAHKIADDPARAKELATAARAQPLDNWSTMGDAQPLLGTPVYTAAKGSVVVAQVQVQQTPAWVVALISDRATVKAKKTPAVDDQTLEAVGMLMLAPAADRLGVRVNPRFGTWDAASANVVGKPSDAPAQVLPPRTP